MTENENKLFSNWQEKEDLAGVKTAIAAGANLDAVDKPDGFTPLIWALIKGHSSVALALIKAGANVNACSMGDTPLHWALSHPNPRTDEIVKHLLAVGADTDAMDNLGHTPLHTAVEHGLISCIEQLWAVGARVNAAKTGEEAYNTPLCVAITMGDLDESKRAAIVKLLLRKGANKRPGGLDMPLREARERNYKTIVKMLQTSKVAIALIIFLFINFVITPWFILPRYIHGYQLWLVFAYYAAGLVALVVRFFKRDMAWDDKILLNIDLAFFGLQESPLPFAVALILVSYVLAWPIVLLYNLCVPKK